MNHPFEPWRTGKHIQAVVGHYGSGKTEIALSLALGARKAGREAAVVDLDIVNPFFRSAEQGAYLAARGVEMIAPPYALTGVDLPVLAADVLSVFERPSLYAVLDVGGDDAGAAALGRFKPQFDAHPAEVFYVVNAYRPFSKTAAQVIGMMDRIAARARVQITGLINNANMGRETSADDLLLGQALLDQVSRETKVPVVCVSALRAVLERLPEQGAPVLEIQRLLMPEWLEN